MLSPLFGAEKVNLAHITTKVSFRPRYLAYMTLAAKVDLIYGQ
jgi:hypothetical protein